MTHRCFGSQHFPNFLRREGGLLVIGIPVRDLQHVQLRGRLAQGGVGRPLPQGFLRAVGQAAHPDAHAGGEHIVDARDHLAAGAEIAAEQDLSALARPGCLRRGIGAVLLQENLGVSQAKAVNRLLHVAHHEAILLLLGQGGKNGILDGVGILVFVHHDLPVAPAQFPCGSGEPRAAFPQEQIQGAVLQVAEIQDAAGPLEPGKVCLKLPHQADNAPGRPGGSPQIRQDLGRVIGKPAGALLQALLAGIPHSLHLVGQGGGTGLAGKAKGTKGHILAGIDLIPGGTGTEEFQLPHQLGDVGRGLFRPVALLQPGLAQAQGLELQIQPGKELLHQIFAPDGLGSVGHALQLHMLQAAVQPALGVQMAAGGIVYLFDDSGNGAVIAPDALGIHKIPEIRRLLPVRVGPVHQILQHRRAQVGAFRLVRHPEIRG